MQQQAINTAKTVSKTDGMFIFIFLLLFIIHPPFLPFPLNHCENQDEDKEEHGLSRCITHTVLNKRRLVHADRHCCGCFARSALRQHLNNSKILERIDNRRDNQKKSSRGNQRYRYIPEFLERAGPIQRGCFI